MHFVIYFRLNFLKTRQNFLDEDYSIIRKVSKFFSKDKDSGKRGILSKGFETYLYSSFFLIFQSEEDTSRKI